MVTKILFLLFMQLVSVMMLVHQKPLPEKIWSSKCKKNSHVLNDCNWCHCNNRHEYTCAARICGEVDMFGHFNDAIREINVGMEGHGVWRSTATACEPGVHYRRAELLCVCGEDGNWPNPVCRDVFRILHTVQLTQENAIKNQKCSPSELHLINCNVCLCPSNGRIDPDLCTKNNCGDNDPVMTKKETVLESTDEIYAQCQRERKYILGCKTCKCLRNNRLICDNCTTDNDKVKTYCSDKTPGEVFSIECNHCQCDTRGFVYCSAKMCISGLNKKVLEKRLSLPNSKFVLTEKPYDDQDCVPGTEYQNGCNTCHCFNKNGMKIFGCTMNKCPNTEDEFISDCVADTVYEVDCLICHCKEIGGVKSQYCQVDHRCVEEQGSKELRSQDLKRLHGYCEPLHVYQRDCNTCKCRADGKTLRCTANICTEPENSLSVDIIPVVQKLGACPKGYSYKIDCNVCFCLSNGNAICTTTDCTTSNKNI